MNAAESYRWHKYVVDWTEGSDTYVLNLLNKSLVCLSASYAAHYRNGTVPKTGPQADPLRTLIRLNFLVPASLADRELLRRWFRSMCRNDRLLAILLVTTYHCNFECAYCYQETSASQRQRHTLRLPSILEWMGRAVRRLRPTALNLTFFGGEPLLAMDVIERTCDYIHALPVPYHHQHRFDVVTNGYLLDADRRQRLYAHNVRTFQITLDGPPDVHDQRRFTTAGNGSFHTILHNIEGLVAERPANIKIRTNIDSQNVHRYPALLRILLDRGLSDKVVLSIVPTKHTPDNLPHCKRFCFSESAEFHNYVESVHAALEAGFCVVPGMEIGPCLATASNAIALRPDGECFKCVNLLNKEGFNIGNVVTDEACTLLDAYLPSPWQQCVACKYVPVCAGGCRYQALVRKGSLTGTVCNKRLFDALLASIYAAQRIHGRL